MIVHTSATVSGIIEQGAVVSLAPFGPGIAPGTMPTEFMIAQEHVIRDGLLWFYMPGADYTGGIRSLPWTNVEVIMGGYVSKWKTDREDVTGRAFLNPIEPWEDWAQRWKTWQSYLSVPENRKRHLEGLSNDQPDIFGSLVQEN